MRIHLFNKKTTILVYVIFQILRFKCQSHIPQDWREAVEEKNAFFALNDDDSKIRGAVLGNGYFSTDSQGVLSSSYFISGHFEPRYNRFP